MVGDPEGTTYIRKSHHTPPHTLVPTFFASRVFGDSERDPLHSELIHPVIGEAATAQHTITNQPTMHNPASLSTDSRTPLSTLRVL